MTQQLQPAHPPESSSSIFHMPVRASRTVYRHYRRRLRRFIYHNLLHADDPPHRLALGMAVGMFVALTPTMGLQMVFAGLLSWCLRANKAVSVAIVWISNPATAVPIYWYCYRIGCAILAMDPIGRPWWVALTTPPEGWWPAVSFYWSKFAEIAGPLWLGSCVVGTICGYGTYTIAYHVIRVYRIRHNVTPPLEATAAESSPYSP